MCNWGKNLLGSAAVFAVMAGAPTMAFAFDEVEWSWIKDIDEDIDIDITIRDNFDTTGMTEVEKLQIQIGDVNAKSVVHDIRNNQPDPEGGGTGTVNETFVFTGNYDGPPADNVIVPIVGAGGTDLDGTITAGTVDENNEAFEFTVEVTGEVDVDPTGSFDAEIELPTVESTATAVGNNQSITSEVATYLHDGQFLFDVQEGNGDNEGGNLDLQDAIGGLVAVGLGSQFADNSHTALAVGASVLAITGTIEKAEVDATSEVYNILNARVDSSATAVGNNIAVDVNNDGSPGDSVLIADITQFSLADISASSSVYNVEVNDYTNLAAVNPLISSSATAVGNNVSINVGNVTTP